VRIEILDKAEDDLVNGFKFYEEQQPGLGAYFRENLSADIDSLQIHGGVHRVVYRNYHRALSKRFPFAIFYTVSGETVLVHAVVDCRRKPAWIKKHLK
jgi:plasmid stabilization system protein ParE